jgi:GH35 family endo-1,4-beta-xylanase
MLKDLAAAKNALIGTEVHFWGNEPQIYKDTIIQEFNLTSFFTNLSIIHPKRFVYDFAEPDRELAFALQNNKKLLASGLIFWWSDPNWVKTLARQYLKPALVN